MKNNIWKKVVLLMAAVLVMTSTAVYAEQFQTGWEYWKTLPDLLEYLDKTSGEIKDELDISEEMTYHGILSMSTYDQAVDVFCDYDATKSGDDQDILQITLNENAEGQYRLGDITVGENRSDSGYWLREDGYVEVKAEAAEENDGSYISTYVNKDEIPVYIVTYDQFSYVIGVIVREIQDGDIKMYEEAR